MPTSARSSWKGAISFGLVTVPVRLYPAVREHSVPLHQVHVKDGSRVRMKRFCEAEDKEIPYEEIGRGYESPGGPTVVLTGEDLATLPVGSKKVIDVLAFIDAGDIDPLMFSKAYYVGTDQAGAKPYVLLREALTESNLVAVTKVTLSTRESLAVLRVHDDVLVLQTMLWPDELTPATDVTPDLKATVRPQELAMAHSLMDTLSEGFDLGQLRDEYQDALQGVVDARLEGAEVPHEGPPRVVGDNVIDLMAALKRSVRAAESARGGNGARARGSDDAEPESDSEAESASAPKAAAAAATRKRAPVKKATTPSARKTAPAAGKKTAPAKSAAKTAAKSPAKKTAATATQPPRRRAS
ncbi:MAG TPA: Ku protein [Actinocrinis sp.]|nr:Ku protein [Actinocrinis sp.]